MVMPMTEPQMQAARQQLERMLGRNLFARSEQLSRLLRFLIEQHLGGRDGDLKEVVIGVEVFGRRPDYNPKADPIVRTEIRRLRQRLREYYQNEGSADAIRFDIPKGGYVPELRAQLVDAPARLTIAPVAPRRRSQWIWLSVCAGLLACVLLAIGITQGGKPLPNNVNSPAYDLYLRARTLEALPNVTGIDSSIDLFEQAISKDPSFAPAYAGIAACDAARSAFDRLEPAERAQVIARGWDAARKAMQLDSRSPDSQEALAMMQARQSQWELAERGFRRVIQIAPREVLWRQHYVMFVLLPLGRTKESIRELRAAEELDPLAPQTHSLLSTALHAVGQYDEAFAHCQKGSDSDQLRAGCWAQKLWRQGKYKEAIAILEPVWSGHLLQPGAQALGVAYAKSGRREDAIRIAQGLPRFASKAQIFAALGDKDRTLELLDQMTAMGPARMGRDFLLSENFSFLRGDPRLKTIRKKAGLPEEN
jgi:tetratricopeptide (TPR) repeat protein